MTSLRNDDILMMPARLGTVAGAEDTNRLPRRDHDPRRTQSMIAAIPTRFDDCVDWLVTKLSRRGAVEQQQERAPEPVIIATPPPQPIDEGEVVKDWVAAYRARRGRDPKVLDVAKDFNLSKTTAWRRMQA